MERGIIKKDGKCYLELPDEYLAYPSAEIFILRSGYYLLSVPLSPNASPQPISQLPQAAIRQLSLDSDAKALVQKLLKIRFEQRTPENVDNMLTADEKQCLQGLLDKGYLTILRSNKYKDGVYNISNNVFAAASKRGDVVQAYASPKEASNTPSPPDQPPMSQDYVVLENADMASKLSYALRKQGRHNSVLGVKGFDGKFYIVTKSFFSKLAPIMLKSLESPKDVDALAAECRLPKDGCLAVLNLLAEQGDVLEKNKGVFALA